MGYENRASGRPRRTSEPTGSRPKTDDADAPPRKFGGLDSSQDVFRKVRERPFTTLGVVFATGLALGLLTGGRDVRPATSRMRVTPAEAEHTELWERRARRLLRVARQQREELHRLRDAADLWDEESPLFPDVSHHGTRESEGRLSSMVRDNLQKFFGGAGSGV